MTTIRDDNMFGITNATETNPGLRTSRFDYLTIHILLFSNRLVHHSPLFSTNRKIAYVDFFAIFVLQMQVENH